MFKVEHKYTFFPFPFQLLLIFWGCFKLFLINVNSLCLGTDQSVSCTLLTFCQFVTQCILFCRNTSSVSSKHDLISSKGSHRYEEWHSDLLGCCSEPLLCMLQNTALFYLTQTEKIKINIQNPINIDIIWMNEVALVINGTQPFKGFLFPHKLNSDERKVISLC